MPAGTTDPIVFRRIGAIHSPWTSTDGMPVQARVAPGARGTVELLPGLEEGLADLAGFSHVYLLYLFHRAAEARLKVIPFLDDRPRGVFATRAPARPNPLGLSVVRLLGIRGNTLDVENLDVLDGTPLLDIKPYVPAFDHWEVGATGWLGRRGLRVEPVASDSRFAWEASGRDIRKDE